MEPWLIALIIKPVAFLGLITFVAYCAWLVRRHMPEGWLKRLLLARLYVANWERGRAGLQGFNQARVIPKHRR